MEPKRIKLSMLGEFLVYMHFKKDVIKQEVRDKSDDIVEKFWNEGCNQALNAVIKSYGQNEEEWEDYEQQEVNTIEDEEQCSSLSSVDVVDFDSFDEDDSDGAGAGAEDDKDGACVGDDNDDVGVGVKENGASGRDDEEDGIQMLEEVITIESSDEESGPKQSDEPPLGLFDKSDDEEREKQKRAERNRFHHMIIEKDRRSNKVLRDKQKEVAAARAAATATQNGQNTAGQFRTIQARQHHQVTSSQLPPPIGSSGVSLLRSNAFSGEQTRPERFQNSFNQTMSSIAISSATPSYPNQIGITTEDPQTRVVTFRTADDPALAKHTAAPALSPTGSNGLLLRSNVFSGEQTRPEHFQESLNQTMSSIAISSATPGYPNQIGITTEDPKTRVVTFRTADDPGLAKHTAATAVAKFNATRNANLQSQQLQVGRVTVSQQQQHTGSPRQSGTFSTSSLGSQLSSNDVHIVLQNGQILVVPSGVVGARQQSATSVGVAGVASQQHRPGLGQQQRPRHHQQANNRFIIASTGQLCRVRPTKAEHSSRPGPQCSQSASQTVQPHVPPLGRLHNQQLTMGTLPGNVSYIISDNLPELLQQPQFQFPRVAPTATITSESQIQEQQQGQ